VGSVRVRRVSPLLNVCEGDAVALPPLSSEDRLAALEKAKKVRKARAEIKDQLKSGAISLGDLLTRMNGPDDDGVVAKMTVVQVLESLPGLGKKKTEAIMERLAIPANRRLQGLGVHQREALLEEVGGRAA
jgi:hypothetical protein